MCTFSGFSVENCPLQTTDPRLTIALTRNQRATAPWHTKKEGIGQMVKIGGTYLLESCS